MQSEKRSQQCKGKVDFGFREFSHSSTPSLEPVHRRGRDDTIAASPLPARLLIASLLIRCSEGCIYDA
jgi:hypothetical protein